MQVDNRTLVLFTDAHLQELQDLYREGYFLHKKLNCRNSREAIASTVSGEWQNSRRISELSGVSYKATAKILYAMAELGDLLRAEENWVDEKYRKRKRFIYKKKGDGGLLLQNLLGIKAPPEHTIFTEYVVRHLIEDAEQGKKTRVR